MCRLVWSTLLFGILASAAGQNAAKPDSDFPPDPRAILDAAAPLYSLSSPEVKPWHLKATYRFYNTEGKPAEQGTWEHWWASPKVYRDSWTRAGLEYSEWSTANGDVYSKGTGSPLRYFERTIEGLVLSPLPERVLLDPGKVKLELRMLPPRKPELACVVAIPKIDGRAVDSANLPSEYCFDPLTTALQVAYANPLVKLYGDLVRMQGHYLARTVEVQYAKRPLFSVSIDTVEGLNSANAAFTPPADAALQRSGRVDLGEWASVEVGFPIKRVVPQYPMPAKTGGEQGTVLLGITIGADGKVHDAELLASPSPSLAAAAMDAVKQWEFKPYLQNGKPVEVESIVNAAFKLSDRFE